MAKRKPKFTQDKPLKGLITPKQRDVLFAFGMDPEVLRNMTKQRASDLIQQFNREGMTPNWRRGNAPPRGGRAMVIRRGER